MIFILAGVAAVLSALPAMLFLANLRHYRPPKSPSLAGVLPSVSVLIPARNEEQSIVAAVESVLACDGVTLEVVVLDDHSEDATARLVSEIANRDSRVRLESAPPLPAGWCGKQHACHVLASHARYPFMLFIDADVRLEPYALAHLLAFQHETGADLVSGFPRQETGTLGEKLVIPLIHFILLGFLPLARSRQTNLPSMAAGCGQLFLARKEAYESMGGHSVIRTSLHDGIKLPRAFRAAGRKTDICDATGLATCRMYRSFGELWYGLAKNATEGLAAPAMIVPATLLLFMGQVLPMILLLCAPWLSWTMTLATAGSVTAYLPRLMGVVRFRQSIIGAMLHPVGVMLLLAIQWYALVRSVVGRPATWKGRSYVQPGRAG